MGRILFESVVILLNIYLIYLSSKEITNREKGPDGFAHDLSYFIPLVIATYGIMKIIAYETQNLFPILKRALDSLPPTLTTVVAEVGCIVTLIVVFMSPLVNEIRVRKLKQFDAKLLRLIFISFLSSSFGVLIARIKEAT